MTGLRKYKYDRAQEMQIWQGSGNANMTGLRKYKYDRAQEMQIWQGSGNTNMTGLRKCKYDRAQEIQIWQGSGNTNMTGLRKYKYDRAQEIQIWQGSGNANMTGLTNDINIRFDEEMRKNTWKVEKHNSSFCNLFRLLQQVHVQGMWPLHPGSDNQHKLVLALYKCQRF